MRLHLLALFGVAAIAAAVLVLPDSPADRHATAGAPAAEEAGGFPTSSCRHRVEGSGSFRFRPRSDIRVGKRLIFWGLRRAQKASAAQRPDESFDYGFKTAVAVRAGESVILSVPPEARGRFALEYAWRPGQRQARTVGEADEATMLDPCPRNQRRFSDGKPLGPWTGWAGGLKFKEPGCYPLDIQFEGQLGRPYRLVIAFATSRRCPPA